MVRRKAEARNEAEETTKLWAKVHQAIYIVQQGTDPSAVANRPESPKLETAAVATETDDMAWLKQMVIEMEVNFQSEMMTSTSWMQGMIITLKSLTKSMTKTATTNSTKTKCNKQF